MATSVGQFREIIATRAYAEPAFRKALLSNPKETLETILGSSLPGNVTVTVVEENSESLYIVIPQPVSDELTEEELSAVAGGTQDVTQNKQRSAEKAAAAADALLRA